MLLGYLGGDGDQFSVGLRKQCRCLFSEQLCIRGVRSNEKKHSYTTTLSTLSSLMVLTSISSRRSGILLFRNELSFGELGVLSERGSCDGVSTGEAREEWGTLSPLVDIRYWQKDVTICT